MQILEGISRLLTPGFTCALTKTPSARVQKWGLPILPRRAKKIFSNLIFESSACLLGFATSTSPSEVFVGVNLVEIWESSGKKSKSSPGLYISTSEELCKGWKSNLSMTVTRIGNILYRTLEASWLERPNTNHVLLAKSTLVSRISRLWHSTWMEGASFAKGKAWNKHCRINKIKKSFSSWVPSALFHFVVLDRFCSNGRGTARLGFQNVT